MNGMERRKYPRFPVHYDVLCDDVDNPSQRRIHAVAENASRTGLKLRYSGLLKTNDQIKLQILKTVSSKPFTCYGRVIWQRESPLVYGENMAGVHITKIGWTETERLITNLDF